MARKHPYVGLPDMQFWRKEAGIKDVKYFDPIGEVSFKIDANDKVVTAGSCFAQHVARYLANSGFNYLVTEQAHPMFGKELSKRFNYGVFSARYGNIYTTRQLKQLLLRAYGQFEPICKSWTLAGKNTFVDPFRPQIQPNGFVSENELLLDQAQHFAAIRQAIEEMSVFVFTLGLTEAWSDKRDGSVYPLAPGVVAGEFNPDIIEFNNFSVEQVLDDLLFSLNFIRDINPKVKFILTVSPVALNATFERRHVLLSTTLSKSVLRIVADEASKRLGDCDYFPSYEIIVSPFHKGLFLADDCREVAPAGVEHVMGLFLKHYGGDASSIDPEVASDAELIKQHLAKMQTALDVLCDEERIDNT